jgi:inorganic triphosphatase YgiF
MIDGEEVEAKFLIDDASVAVLASLRRIGDYRLRSQADQRLRTVYLDTADRRLARAGVAFRVRYGGDRLEASIKKGGGIEGDVHRRREVTVALARSPRASYRPPAGRLRDEVDAVAPGARLFRTVETRVFRRRRSVRDAAGRIVAELDLDRVEFRAPGVRGSGGPEVELEIELGAGGHGRDLERIIDALREHVTLRPSPRSKLERALAWADAERRRSEEAPRTRGR